MKLPKNKGINIIVGVAIVLKIVLHLISDTFSGFLGDEFLHIDTGRNLALGYADFPPMIGIIAWIQNLFHSDSIILNRLFIHLSGIAVMLISAYVVLKLGGKWKAMILAMLTFLISPLIGVSHTLFLPIGLNQFFHVLCVLFLFLYYRDEKHRYLFFLAISVGLGVLTKYSIGMFMISMVTGVLIFDRQLLKKRDLWFAIVVFLLVISPNLLWQIRNDFPVLDHFEALSKLDLEKTSFKELLILLFTYINPFTFIISVLGILYLVFESSFKQYRVIGVSLLMTVVLILAAHGKFYYIMPAIIAAIPFGSVIMERYLTARKEVFIFGALIMLISGILIVPLGMPFFSPERFVKLYHIQKVDDGRTPIYLDHFHTKELWANVVTGVKEVYEDLPEEDRDKCLVWGRHYSYAGLINLYQKKFDLPDAISMTSCYYDWLPAFGKDKVIIAVGEYNLRERFWLQYFESVKELKSYRDMYSKDYQNSGIRIFICKGLKYNATELKTIINKYGM